MKIEKKAKSLQRRLAEAEENLQLIHERKSEFVQQTSIPLDLIKDERRLVQETEALRAQLGQLPAQRGTRLAACSRVRARMAIGGAVGLALVVAASSITLGILPLGPSPPAGPTPISSPGSAGILRFVDEPSLPGCDTSCSVRAISPTPDGMLLALDTTGVVRIGGQGFSPGQAGGLLALACDVAEGPDGRVWVGTLSSGLVELAPGWSEPKVHTQTTDGMTMAMVTAVELDGQGGIWVGASTVETAGVDVYLLDAAGRWHPHPWAEKVWRPINDIARDGQGRVWFATSGGGVCCLDPETGTWAVHDQRSCAGMDERLPSNDVFAIYVSEDGRKWLGTAAGLVVLDDRGDEVEWHVLTQAHGLPHNRVVALAGDGRGRVFVGTEAEGEVEGDELSHQGGLSIVSDEINVMEVRTFSHSVSALAFDPQEDKLWVGTQGGGLSIWSVD